MDTAIFGSRLVLGSIFVFGGVEWLRYIVTGRLIINPPMTDRCRAFIGTLVEFRALWGVLKLVQLFGGLAMLSGVIAPLGALMVLPVVTIIVTVLVLLNAPKGLPLATVLILCQLILLYGYRLNYAALFAPPM